jgi:hypothetical protein
MAKRKYRYITVLVAEETYQAIKADSKKSKKTIASLVRAALLTIYNAGVK